MHAEALELPFASYEYQEKKKKSFLEKIKDIVELHQEYEGLFTPIQCQRALEISSARFYEIADRLEKIPVEMLGGKEYYTGRGLIKYRKEAVPDNKK